MRRSRRGQWMLTREARAPAITRFLSRPLPGEEAADGSGARRDLRGFLLLPRTGKTHQLRVALKSLGAPVLGDALYADAAAAALEARAYISPTSPLYLPYICPTELGRDQVGEDVAQRVLHAHLG